MAEKLRTRLSRLLRARMDATPALDTQMKVHKASGLAQSTIQRLLAQDQAATVDVIEELAKPFGVDGRHFLLDPDEVKLLDLYSRMSADDKQRALAYMQVSVETHTRANPPYGIVGVYGSAGVGQWPTVTQVAPPSAPAPSPSVGKAYSWDSPYLPKR